MPNIVLLHIGSNDLCDFTKSVDVVFREYTHLILCLRYTWKIPKIIILQTLHRHYPRCRTRFPLDIPTFNNRVDEFNRKVSAFSQSFPGCFYKKLKGFWACQVTEVYCPDGVHLSQSGNIKYFNNIRAAIVAVKKQLEI